MGKDKEPLLRSNIKDIGLDIFPDDDVDWEILETKHQGGYSCIEAKPSPPMGYPCFKFITCIDEDDSIQVPACYALIDGQWRLLCSSPEEKKDWRDYSW